MVTVIILAAGKGTRMNDMNIPKVCRKVGDLTMIEHVVKTSQSLIPKEIIVVVSDENKEIIKEILGDKVTYKIQKELNGTASAVLAAEVKNDDILVLLGDVPLLKSRTLQNIVDMKQNCVILGFRDYNTENKFGRIIKEEKKIVEYNEATEEEKKVTFVNSGILYLSKKYLPLLKEIKNENSKKEYYLRKSVV